MYNPGEDFLKSFLYIILLRTVWIGGWVDEKLPPTPSKLKRGLGNSGPKTEESLKINKPKADILLSHVL